MGERKERAALNWFSRLYRMTVASVRVHRMKLGTDILPFEGYGPEEVEAADMRLV